MEQKGNHSLGSALGKLSRLLMQERKDVTAIYGFSVLSGLVDLTLPLGIQTMISFVMAGSVSTSIFVLILLVVAGVFVNGLLQVRQMQVIERVEQKLFVRYSFAFADRLPRLNIHRLDNYYLPELVNRFFDTMNLQKGLAKLLLDIPTASIQLIFGLILLSLYHPVFIVFGLILFLILFLILRFTAVRGMETSLNASDYKYKVAAWLEEMARSIKTFKYSKGTSLHLREADRLTSGYLQSATAHFMVLQKQYWSLIGFKVLITAAMLIVGVVLLLNQQLNIGQFAAAEIVILTIIKAVEKFITSLEKVYDVLTALEKLGKVTSAELETEGTLSMINQSEGIGIEFESVSFGYSEAPQVLRNLSFKISRGEHVAIMGVSGSGKSTLLRLLTGSFTDFEGSILLDDIPIGNYTLSSIRPQTGILLSTQDIFRGSLLNNITMGDDSFGLEEVSAMAALTGLNLFIKEQKLGYDTLLDPTGKRLPKKVIQATLLTRALLGKRRLLLLEEPCQYLMPTHQEAVLDYLKKDSDSTILIATNDPKIACSCDKVLFLDKGNLMIQGTWEQVNNHPLPK